MRRLTTAGLKLIAAAALAALVPACTSNSSNAAAPTFGGLVSANTGGSTGQVVLTWNPAVDYAGGGITYLIYTTNTGSGNEDLSNANYGTTSSTGYTVTGLVSSNTYWFIVRAEDVNGNTDSNTVEFSAVAK